MDWIEGFLEHTSRLPSPEIFRLWAGISAVAGALERRVWVVTSVGATYANLFTLLVAPPAIGKSVAISQARNMWAATASLGDNRRVHIAPNSVTKASLLDNLVKSAKRLVIDDGKSLLEFHSLSIASSEFGVLLPSHDTEFMSVLNDIFDNIPEFREDRRTSKCVDITCPQLNILAGTQPGFLATLLPEEAWSMGFMSRVVMVYAGSGPQIELFDLSNIHETELSRTLKRSMVKMLDLMGQAHFTEGAQTEIVRWYRAGMAPLPEHSKLAHYNGRRLQIFLKLLMIAAVSRSGQLKITFEDVQRARDWLLGVEHYMPDVFREMVGRSDGQLIQDLHFFMWKEWLKHKKPLHETFLYQFLSNRTTSEKPEKIIEVALRAGVIARPPGTTALFIPRPKNEHGME